MDDNKEYTVLLEDPLIRVDFSRMTVGDIARLMANQSYGFTLMSKCIIDDLDKIPSDYALVIIQAYTTELGRFMHDLVTTHEIMKATPNVTH